jgi:hypothetical protein
VVNRLQDLVFNTIGNDSLDLPQIVRVIPLAQAVHGSKAGCAAPPSGPRCGTVHTNSHRSSSDRSRLESRRCSRTSSAETFSPEATAS